MQVCSSDLFVGMIRKEESVCWITCGDYNLGRLLILIEGTVQALCTRC